jgi:hypothetical protein
MLFSILLNMIMYPATQNHRKVNMISL